MNRRKQGKFLISAFPLPPSSPLPPSGIYELYAYVRNPSLSVGVIHQDPKPCSYGTHIYTYHLLVYLINIISAEKSKRREDVHSISKSSLSLDKSPMSNGAESNHPSPCSSVQTTTTLRRTTVNNQAKFTKTSTELITEKKNETSVYRILYMVIIG